MSKIILGIEIERRRNIAIDVQEILTEFGCFIKTRIGLHEASDDRQICSENGLMLLELIKDSGKEGAELEERLARIEGVVVKKMEF
jgi:hypothetical protein